MKVKRILSALLTLSLLLSCICIFVSAEGEAYTGVYKGYNYYCSGHVSSSSCNVYMSYADTSAPLRIEATYKYKNTKGETLSSAFMVNGKEALSKIPAPAYFSAFISLTPEYFISGNSILRFSLSA